MYDIDPIPFKFATDCQKKGPFLDNPPRNFQSERPLESPAEGGDDVPSLSLGVNNGDDVGAVRIVGGDGAELSPESKVAEEGTG